MALEVEKVLGSILKLLNIYSFFLISLLVAFWKDYMYTGILFLCIDVKGPTRFSYEPQVFIP